MNVSLPPQLEALVYKKVASGLYDSASEVISEALRLLFEYEKFWAEELRREIRVGADQIQQGKYKVYGSADDLMNDIQLRGQARLKSRRP